MRRKRATMFGEIRFRITKKDRERLDWLMAHHPDEHTTVSALLRTLLLEEHDRLKGNK